MSSCQYCDLRRFFPRNRHLAWMVCAIMYLPSGSFILAAEPGASSEISAEQRKFFESKIRPVLVQHCYTCHSVESKELGGKLRLDDRASMWSGGQSGPALSRESPEESLLMDALRYEGLEMPPDAPLSEQIINDFAQWVRMGAPDPRDSVAAQAPGDELAESPHWSFSPVISASIPTVSRTDWPRDPLDHFVLKRQEEAGVQATRDASSAVLARRLYFDLIGLPPTRQEVEDFIAADREQGGAAREALVDRLLASPHFGERWGRHWLDVARYGESNGNDGLSRNPTFPHAWRYRDYVIQAFNDDVPYDRFITEQIAGDLLAADDPAARDRQLIATGFLALGSKPAKAMNQNFDMDVVTDQIDVISTGLLGLSVACARCHDHKHDPIPTADFYALAGIFLSTETMWGLAANEKLTAPPTPLHQLQAAHLNAPTSAAADAASQPAAGENQPVTDPQAEGKSADTQKDKSPKLIPAQAMGVRDKEKIQNCKINVGGESTKLGPEVPRGFLSACQTSTPPPLIDEARSGRLELAEWLTRGDHPLTSRVMVNRIWLHLFGQGIVSTPNDFGLFGAEPSHPELLDHLATRFQAEGWSIKKLIRAIVLSRTYQLDSFCAQELFEADPDNRLYTRHRRRRLDAESLRDSMLFVSGELNFEPGQGSIIQHLDVLVNKQGSLHQPSRHRSVYLCLLRNSPPPELAAFDLPDALRPQGQRNESTLPTQSLFLLNNPFVVEQSAKLAQLALTQAGSPPEMRCRWLFSRVFNREPNPVELEATLQLYRTLTSEGAATDEAPLSQELFTWSTICQAYLASSEFRYVD